MRKGLALGALMLALAMPAEAQQQVSDALSITVVNVTARESDRENADQAAGLPGDVLEYSLEFTNTQPGPISNVVLSDPIPEGTTLVLGQVFASRQDVAIDYSIDEGASWAVIPQVEVEINGQSVLRPAPPEAYTHVRWTVTGDIAPGAQVTARFRTRVDELAPNGGE